MAVVVQGRELVGRCEAASGKLFLISSQVLLQPQAMQVLVKSVADCDVGSASNLFPPLLRILQYKRLNRKLGVMLSLPPLLSTDSKQESDMLDELLKRLDHPEAVVRKVVLQIIQVEARVCVCVCVCVCLFVCWF